MFQHIYGYFLRSYTKLRSVFSEHISCTINTSNRYLLKSYNYLHSVRRIKKPSNALKKFVLPSFLLFNNDKVLSKNLIKSNLFISSFLPILNILRKFFIFNVLVFCSQLQGFNFRLFLPISSSISISLTTSISSQSFSCS